MIKKLSILILCLFAFACSRIEYGEIYKKEYEPENRWTTTTYTKVGSMRIPNTVHHVDDEDWVVHIKHFDREKNKWRTNSFEVSKKLYERAEIGDKFDKQRGLINDDL